MFPTELDLEPYRDATAISSDGQEGLKQSSKYELFSVIVHKGSCYGGHYHCFIRDKDAIGKWTPPENEKVNICCEIYCIVKPMPVKMAGPTGNRFYQP